MTQPTCSPAARPKARPMCGERVLLPSRLVEDALAVEPAASAGTDDVERDLRCTLEAHADGDHYGFVREPAGAGPGGVWTRWESGQQPGAILVLPDCEAAGPPETGREACGEFAGHPGGHTWELAERWRVQVVRSLNGRAGEASRAGQAEGAERTWTIATTSGYTASGYLPPWADEDPSRTGVPLDRLSAALDDIRHHAAFDGQLLPVSPDGGPAKDTVVLSAAMVCDPCAEDPALRVPVVNLQLVDDYWMNGFGPDQLAGVAVTLRIQADYLDREVRPALVTARAQWAEYHGVREAERAEGGSYGGAGRT